MSFPIRPVLATLLLAGSAALLTACDYKYSPGVNLQFKHDFSNPPGYSNADVYRDSVNYKQNVHTPIGVGSANDVQTGGVNAQLNSAPAGHSAASPQSASGQLGSVDQAEPTKANTTSPKQQ